MLRRLKRRQRYEYSTVFGCCCTDSALITEVHSVNDDRSVLQNDFCAASFLNIPQFIIRQYYFSVLVLLLILLIFLISL